VDKYLGGYICDLDTLLFKHFSFIVVHICGVIPQEVAHPPGGTLLTGS
jgi:hypothetical protein